MLFICMLGHDKIIIQYQLPDANLVVFLCLVFLLLLLLLPPPSQMLLCGHNWLGS